jgi:exonuclease VII small subunit
MKKSVDEKRPAGATLESIINQLEKNSEKLASIIGVLDLFEERVITCFDKIENNLERISSTVHRIENGVNNISLPAPYRKPRQFNTATLYHSPSFPKLIKLNYAPRFDD